ncbi:MAG: DUF177 domain-containing protein [Bacteroidaceae bacterium]|jgi:uncharacterized metal-binding protein YceD (DUF177 family)|nr:DUF177 domain-containing protein [Bacteroidaceae bacterium]MBQ5713631.1 DUF177 domain-containing protein [Bacteroidaceae bacterium]MBR0543157.1 DUF177 domain-containing protein [Bacteroidaceae bacterium]
MGKLDGYKVDLKGMATDTVSYRWQADNDFFSAVQGSEIKQGLLDVALRVKRTSGAYELEFQLQGEVEVTCDRCLESMNQPIDAFCTLRVVMGEDFVDDGDVVVIPEREGVINVAWNIYEFAALQIPLRHVHPDCEALSESSEEERVDPRWADLKKLINSKQ